MNYSQGGECVGVRGGIAGAERGQRERGMTLIPGETKTLSAECFHPLRAPCERGGLHGVSLLSFLSTPRPFSGVSLGCRAAAREVHFGSTMRTDAQVFGKNMESESEQKQEVVFA